MSKIIILWMTLKKNKLERPIKIIKEVVSLILILVILMSFTILFQHIQHTFSVLYSQTEFDFIVREFNEYQIEEIGRLPFVDVVFPVRIISGSLMTENSVAKNLITIYAANSFEGREASFFSDKLIIKMDNNILLNEDMNPIIIDYITARELRVRLGDKLYIPFGKDGTKVLFNVAAISETAMGTQQALILWKGEQQNVFNKHFGNDLYYSEMFVKTNDIEIARDYFLYEYIPMQMVDEGHFSLYDIDKILEFNQNMLTEREKKLELILWELTFTPPIVFITAILGFITYLLVLYREVDKKVKGAEKSLSILHALGMPKIYFVLYLLLDTVLIHFPLLGVSTLIVKYVIYDLLMSSFMPWYMLKWYFLIALLLQLMAVLLNGILAYLKMKTIETATQLSKE